MLRSFVFGTLLFGLAHAAVLAGSLDPARSKQIDADVRTILHRTKTPSAVIDQFAPFGSPTRFVYKGSRPETNTHWYDYVIEFGPGSQLKFAVGVDAEGKIASISYG